MGEILPANLHFPPPVEAENLEARSKILAVEAGIMNLPGERFVGRDDVELHHYFANGCYVRAMILPPGVVLTGAIHKHDTINIVSHGHLYVMTETEGTIEILGPNTFIGPKWTKRAIHVVKPTVWHTVHPWDGETTDPEELRNLLAWETYEDMESDLEAGL